MDWTDPIDAYCERLSPAFWAEPVNAVSNLAFLVACALGLLAWRRARRTDPRTRDVAGLLLALLVGVIGIGSFLFHTFANRWSALADVAPIAVFIYGYFALALHRFGGLGLLASGAGTLLFLGASFLAEPLFARFVGSSAGYVPALLALFGIGLWLRRRNAPASRAVLLAGAAFLVSLTLRTLDGPLCGTLPLGTHFLWHVLNAATLGILLLAAIREGARPRRRKITP